jgi:hypothetical protein
MDRNEGSNLQLSSVDYELKLSDEAAEGLASAIPVVMKPPQVTTS